MRLGSLVGGGVRALLFDRSFSALTHTLALTYSNSTDFELPVHVLVGTSYFYLPYEYIHVNILRLIVLHNVLLKRVKPQAHACTFHIVKYHENDW